MALHNLIFSGITLVAGIGHDGKINTSEKAVGKSRRQRLLVSWRASSWTFTGIELDIMSIYSIFFF